VGKLVVSKSGYQARGFALEAGEPFPADAAAFDRKAHTPRLVPISKGQEFALLGTLPNGEAYALHAADGREWALLLYADSFEEKK